MKYFVGLMPLLILLFMVGYLVVLVVRRVRQEKEFKLKLQKIREESDIDE